MALSMEITVSTSNPEKTIKKTLEYDGIIFID